MKRTALALILLLIVTASCKKTVESEKKSWKNNFKIVNALVYDYPSFASIIKEHIVSAESKMKDAEAIVNENDKIKKMAEVNSFLKSGFIRNLEEISFLKKSIKSKTVEVRGINVDFNERRSIEQAVFYADGAVVKSEDKIKQHVSNKAEAEALSSSVYSDLKYAKSDLDRIIDSARTKEKNAQQKIEEDKSAKDKLEKYKLEEAKPLICKYCSTSNDPKTTACKSCGAPLR